jgi:hypothetical protein
LTVPDEVYSRHPSLRRKTNKTNEKHNTENRKISNTNPNINRG